MPAVTKYAALVLMLAAGILVAATDALAEETKTSIEMSIVECEGEAEGEKCVKLCIVKNTDGETESKTIIITGDGKIDCDGLLGIKKLKLAESGTNICIVCTIGDDGEFKAVIVHDGEVQKFEDRESFDEYLESHPELKIEVEDCLPRIEEPILEE